MSYPWKIDVRQNSNDDILLIDPDEVVAAAAWFAIATKVIDELGEEDVTQQRVHEYLSDEEFLYYLKDTGLDEYVNAIYETDRSNAIYDFCCSVLEMDYNKKYMLYFQRFCPNAIADWSALENYLGKSKTNMFTIVYLVLKDAGEMLGETQSVLVKESEIFRKRERLFSKLDVDLEVYIECWEAIHYTKLSEQIIRGPSQAIKNAKKVFAKKRLPQQLLDQVLLGKKYKEELLAAAKESKDQESEDKKSENKKSKNQQSKDEKNEFNPWAIIKKLEEKKGEQIERGLTKDEQLFNEAVYQLILTPAIDIIQEVFYKNRDDSAFECSFLFNEVKALATESNKIIVINPSPSFLKVCSEDEQLKKSVTFVVWDQTIRDLYLIDFPDYHFVLKGELENAGSTIDLLVFMQRDLTFGDFSEVFSHCKEGANVLAMVPQISHAKGAKNILDSFEEKGIYAHAIVTVPSETVQSKPKKKMVVYAQKGDGHRKNKIKLIFSNLDSSREYIVTEKRIYNVSLEKFKENRSLIQIRNGINKRLEQPDIEHRESARIVSFSKEISVCGTVFPGRKGEFSARAFYRAIPREKDKHRKHGRRVSPRTEKGLVAKTEEEILSKICATALYDEFSPSIIEDILSCYADCLNTLTLKTVWYCCRPDLLAMISYNDEIAGQLFCGDNQELSDLYPEETDSEQFSTVMEKLIPSDKTGEKQYWKQLNLIMQKAVERGFIAKNPVEYCMPLVNQRSSKTLNQIRSNLSKHQFSDTEEAKMVNYLLEVVKEDVSRCVCESKWLIGMIRLFTGMPLREICALQWKHLKSIGVDNAYQFEAVQYLDANNIAKSYVQYHNQKKLRKIPLAPVLADVLIHRQDYLQKRYGYLPEDILEQPIVLEKEIINRRKKKFDFCSRETARSVSRKLLEKAEIPEDRLTLLDGEQQFYTDLNATSRDLYYANFRHKSTIVCGFTNGQLSYVTGTKPEDTLSEHYVDYANAFLQYDMVCRLNRWSYIYEPQPESNQKEPRLHVEEVHSGSIEKAEANPVGLASLSMDLMVRPTEETGEIVLTVESNHGVQGKITVYGRKEQAHGDTAEKKL